MRQVNKKVKKIGSLLVATVIFISVSYSKSIAYTGTFTNENTKLESADIAGYAEASSLEKDIVIKYPEYCEVIPRDTGDFDILNNNPAKDGLILINVDTNMEPKYPFNKMSFRKLPYIFVKYTYRFKPTSETVTSFYRLEKINDEWTMVFYDVRLSKDNNNIYNCQYYYINENDRLNNINITTTDSEVFTNVLGTIEY